MQRLSPPTPRTPNILVMLFQMLNITLPVSDRHPSVKFLDVPMSLGSNGASVADAEGLSLHCESEVGGEHVMFRATDRGGAAKRCVR